MKKFYRFSSYLFVIVIILANFLIIIFQKDIISYLDTLNNLQNTLQSASNVASGGQEALFDLRFMADEKFRRLQETTVDYSGLELPDDFSEISTSTEAEVDFKVGNSNPFKSF